MGIQVLKIEDEHRAAVHASQLGLNHVSSDASWMPFLVSWVFVQRQDRPDERVWSKVEQSSTTKLGVENSMRLGDICLKALAPKHKLRTLDLTVDVEVP